MLQSYGRFECGPKGKSECGETNLQTALRECEEETGIMPDELEFKWGTDYIETEPYLKGKKVARFFVAEVQRKTLKLPINPNLGYPEHSAYEWLDYNKAHSKLNVRLQRVLEWAKSKVKDAL
jgi:bis(5'-nucleosidyl)-tetraphosphatase